jgi:2-polyprenyl-3-methyl-5-hydroxy-6-metoxy-1,4-benzoquinol methylase
MEGGNVYDKYGSDNPIERRLVARFKSTLLALVSRSGAGEAHEAGCGEGELTRLLASRGIRARGSDLSEEVIAEARRRTAAAGVAAEFSARDLLELAPPEDAAELVLCCEVLEHLPDPGAALGVLAELARPWAILSVPREPLWRALNVARGAYLGELGNTPGHLNHWSRHGFERLLATHFELVEVRAPLPWTMALCRSRPAASTAAGGA